MPWPGLQTTLWIRKFEVPGPIEMQSSPVLIMEFKIWNLDECCTWIPSVFKLFPGAKTFSLSNFTLLHPLNTMWNIWLFIEVSHLITMFFELENSIVCQKKKKKVKENNEYFSYNNNWIKPDNLKKLIKRTLKCFLQCRCKDTGCPKLV